MDKIIREAIFNVLKNNIELIKIAIRQRAKFEGWLKFELACYLELHGMQNVEVESCYNERVGRSDISFKCKEKIYHIELKTPNTSYRINNIDKKQKPITDNINSIIEDTKKLDIDNGVVAFVLFPVPHKSEGWYEHIIKIGERTNININKDNCIIFNDDNLGLDCDLIICSFMSRSS